MSAPFVAQLRTGGKALRLGAPGEPVITLRVQIADTWDTIRVDAPDSMPVSVVKQQVLATLMPDTPHSEEFVTKLNGWEVLDESVPLTEAGVVNGSTLLLHFRRRRPVR